MDFYLKKKKKKYSAVLILSLYLLVFLFIPNPVFPLLPEQSLCFKDSDTFKPFPVTFNEVKAVSAVV